MNQPHRSQVFPEIGTPRLTLREITDAHLNDIYELFSHEKVTRFYNLSTFNDLSKAQSFIDWNKNLHQQNKAIRWGISLKDSDEIIGTIGFNKLGRGGRANIGYDLHPDYWNQGYITEALKFVCLFGFQQLYLNRIEAEVMPGNLASEKALYKAGFKKDGLLNQWMYWKGRSYDMVMFSLHRKSFKIMQVVR